MPGLSFTDCLLDRLRLNVKLGEGCCETALVKGLIRAAMYLALKHSSIQQSLHASTLQHARLPNYVYRHL